jgi:hypothetical protein
VGDLDVRALARVINKGDDDPAGGDLRLRRGIVTAVAATTVTVTIGGVSVAGVPVYRSVLVRVGDTVDLILDGPAPRIVGVLGAYAGAPRADRFVTASSQASLTIPSATMTRLTFAGDQGNIALFNNATSILTIPETGTWLLTARVRCSDALPAGLNVGICLNDTDTFNEARTAWNGIPSGGTRRLSLHYSTVETVTAATPLRLVGYSDGAAAPVTYRHLSATMLTT